MFALNRNRSNLYHLGQIDTSYSTKYSDNQKCVGSAQLEFMGDVQHVCGGCRGSRDGMFLMQTLMSNVEGKHKLEFIPNVFAN